ncbi:MAG: hypothetical protein WA633_27075 [Stellaceae bacterium]
MLAVDAFVVDDDFHMLLSRYSFADPEEWLLISEVSADAKGHLSTPNNPHDLRAIKSTGAVGALMQINEALPRRWAL